MKVLIYSPIPPSRMSSGALMLYQLLSLDKKNEYFCFCVIDPLRKIPVEFPGKNVHIKTMRRPVENAIRLSGGIIGDCMARVFEKIKHIYISKIIISQAVMYGKKNNVDCVWAILQGRTVILSALTLSEKLKVPLKCQIWDEPDWILKDTNIDMISFEETVKCYEKTLSQSNSIACASFMMRDKYKKHKIPTFIFLGSLANSTRSAYKKSKTFYIGFAGQIYAKEEWMCLIKALNSLCWKVDDRDIKIKLIGKFNKKFILGLPIEALGYKSQEDVLKILSGTDLNYCPYWFDLEHKNISKTSFPSKLTSYLACNRPVLVHAPEYSSPVKFFRANKCGFVCNTLNYKKLAQVILMISRGQYNQSTLQNQAIAFKKYLTFEYQKKQMDNFLKLN